MRDKGIFFDLTRTFYGGRLTKILDASIVMTPAFRSPRAASDDRARQRYDSLVQRVLKSGVKLPWLGHVLSDGMPEEVSKGAGAP